MARPLSDELAVPLTIALGAEFDEIEVAIARTKAHAFTGTRADLIAVVDACQVSVRRGRSGVYRLFPVTLPKRGTAKA